MRTIAVLFSLSLLIAVGCGVEESSTAIKNVPTNVPTKALMKVDMASLETIASESSVTLVDFSAEW